MRSSLNILASGPITIVWSQNSMVNLGDIFPNFKAKTNDGTISFHDWLDGSWAILFSHPADYTPVCTTELATAGSLDTEFKKRGVKMIGLSCDGVDSHNGWIEDVKGFANQPIFPFSIIADEDRELAVKLGMLDPDLKDDAGLPLTCRAVFIIGPDKRLKLSMLYPATTGRNFDEILRVIDSLQLTTTKRVATPANWKNGDDCLVVPSVKPEEIPNLFPKGVRIQEVPSGKQYLKYTPQPN